ncbi:MAG: hypothetical protein NW203_06950 [Hyphomonadaceae bacterium]|nr:hypothetical protein [Hyphomonadaceae bacterium]
MRSLLVATVMFACIGTAHAQIDAEAQLAQMQAQQAQAQAAASRPGDEALTCEQLMAEFNTTMNDPQFRAALAQSGAWAQQRQQQMQGAQGMAMAGMGIGMAMGVASAFVPGLGYAQGAMMNAQAGQMQRQAQQNQADMITQAGNAQAMMPAAYRGQRLYELAQAKQCPFLAQAAQEAPVVIPSHPVPRQ